jgi:hypothetical protein
MATGSKEINVTGAMCNAGKTGTAKLSKRGQRIGKS